MRKQEDCLKVCIKRQTITSNAEETLYKKQKGFILKV